MIHKAVDLFLVYQFLKRLALPFSEWKAFKAGVINEKGDIIVKKFNRTPEQKQAFGKFDLMILKLKKLLGKVPGGSTKIASYMAALWLIKEWNQFTDKPLINESISDVELNQSLNLFLEWYLYYTNVLEEGNAKITEEGEGGAAGGAPTVNVGSGNIAGLGVGPQGEPGLTRAQQMKHKKRAAATMPDLARRKTFAAFVKEAAPMPATYSTTPMNVRRDKKVKHHPRPTVRDA